MAARSALLGMALSVMAVNAMAASPIPVVNAGAEAPAAGSVRTATGVAIQQVQSVGEPVMLLNQIETLQREVMDLRGLLEEQANAIHRIQTESRDRYLDLDRRISSLTTGRAVAGNVDPGIVAPTGVTGAVAGSTVKSAGSAGHVVIDRAGEALYQDTFQLIRDRKFPEASTGLRKYLNDYPKGPFVDNAQYWLGEVNLAQGNLKEAEVDFTLLIKKYPFSEKLADATYKLGQVYDRLGDREKAKQYLQRAIENFPGSSAARLADVYLRSMDS